MVVEIGRFVSSANQGGVPRLSHASLTWNRQNAFSGSFKCEPSEAINFPFEKNRYGVHPNGCIHGPDSQCAIDTSEFQEVIKQLYRSIYIGPFRNAVNTGAARYYDLSIGTEFITTWHEWKTGEGKAAALAVERVTEDIRRIFGSKKLEIAATQRLNTLQVAVNGKPYKLRELGAGLSQFILVFGAAAFQKPDYIFIDE